MYTTLYILLHVAAFPLTYFIVSKVIIFLENRGFKVHPKHHDNKLVFSLIILSIFLVYFSLSAVITNILDMYISK